MKTLLHIAIFTFQLDECLRVGRTVHPQATLAPDTDDAVVLGLQVFQQSDSPLAKKLIAHVVSIGIQERADGIDDHDNVIISFPDIGTDIRKEKRKIHFMNVTAEYFAIKGLKMPRYIEKLRLLSTIMKMPNGVLSVTPPGAVTLLTIR